MSSKGIVNTFSGGMDKDTDKSLLSNKSYLDAQNFRIITTIGGSSGSLENVRGNHLLEGTGGNIDSGQRIIGSCEIRDTVVLFTTNNTSTTPSGGKSQIYKLTLDLNSEVQLSLTKIYDDNLNEGLAVTDFLNFSTANPIKAIARYETPNVQKIFFTDTYNNLRYMNIANNLTMDGTAYSVTNEYMSIDKFEFLPKFIFNKPILYDIIGGNINTGMVAYAYQLYIVNGAETAFSAVSDPIHVVADNDSLASTLNYNGSPNEESSGKGFLLKIVNSNTGYNRLRLIRIEYHNINQIPIIYIANEIEIGAEPATIYITDTGEVHGEITLDEFNITSTELFKCKDIGTKDNRLFVTNITKSEFVVDPTWDARAIRFDNTGVAYIHDTTTGTSAVTLGTWAAVYTPEHDGINKFNDPDNDGDGDFKWIYQSNGETLGAEGPNVKIDFETEPFVLDNSNNDSTFYVDAPTNATDLSYKNYASPWKAGKLSWQRDEVYRLFVVFGNDRGQTSEPKWMCDLRMPSLHDDTFNNSDSAGVYPWRLAGDNGDGTIYSNRLYPRILFKSFPTNASWAQIHRVKRERKDRSVVTQGLAMGSYQDKLDGIAYRLGFHQPGTHYVHDMFIMDDGSGSAPIKIMSPEINVTKNISQRSNDYIEHVTDFGTNYTDTISIDEQVFFNTIIKLKTNIRIDYNASNRASVIAAKMVLPASLSTDFVLVNNKQYYNYEDSISRNGGKGCSGFVIQHNNGAWSANATYAPIVNYKSNVYGSQYGGYTYEDRIDNISIPCSDVITPVLGISNWSDINYGDTFINYFDITTMLLDLAATNESGYDTYGCSVYVPLESSINCDLIHSRSSSHITYSSDAATLRQEYLGTHTVDTWTYEQTEDLYAYNTVYSQSLDLRYAIPLTIDKTLETEFDCMVKVSNMKHNGEIVDSWSKFGVNAFIELDSSYGPSTALKNFNDKLFAFQDKAFSVLAVNVRSLVTDNNAAQIVLGTGGVLDRAEYVSTITGCKDKFSIAGSSTGMFWYDRVNNYLVKYSGDVEKISQSKGIQSYLSNYVLPEHIVISHPDINNSEVLFTFHDPTAIDNFTISYNELVDNFISFYSFIPTLYVPYNNRYLTTTVSGGINKDRLYLHDSSVSNRGYFYGVYYDSSLELLFNPEYISTKVFDNIFYISNAYAGSIELFSETFNTVQCYNDFQNTGEITLAHKTNLERRERGWSLVVPRSIVDVNVSSNPNKFTEVDPNQLFKERMRDKFLIVYFTYDNDGNRFTVSSIGAKYRNSLR